MDFEVGDATKREFPSESFDAVFSSDAILHIRDKRKLFSSFYVSLQWLLCVCKLGAKVLILSHEKFKFLSGGVFLSVYSLYRSTVLVETVTVCP